MATDQAVGADMGDLEIDITHAWDVTAEYPANRVTLHAKTAGGAYLTVSFGAPDLERACDALAEATAEYHGANA